VYIPLLNIGGLTLEVPLLLAPMANVTDSPYRLMCRRSGAALVFTELISAEGLIHKSKKTWALARFQPEERPLGVQIFTHDPQAMARAAVLVEEQLQPEIIDINFGCPVRKVVSRGAGAGFMEDPQRIGEAVRAVVTAVKTPVTAKFRSGPVAERLTVVEAAQAAEASGAAAVTVHGRTTVQQFRGKADWDVIARVKQAVKIPVIGNGDVTNAEAMLKLFEQTGCDGAMIGRGALGNPWIFRECRAAIEGRPWQPLTPQQMWPEIEFHYCMAVELKGINGLWEMRRYLSYYSKGLSGAAEYRQRVFRLEDAEEVIKVSKEFFLGQTLVTI
jgi:nifR3 family TIM-barrel protein